MFENQDHKHKTLERSEFKHGGNLSLPYCLRSTIAVEVRTFMVLNRSRVNDSNRVLNDRPPSPGTRPFLEYRVPLHRILQSRDKAVLSLLVVRRQQERKPVQGVFFLEKDLVEIAAARVRRRARDVLCSRHLHLRGDSCFFFRASCFSTYRVRTPPQVNFAPFFIRSKIASSPSRLMTLRFLRSMTNLRPSSSRPAFLQVVPSSSTQAPVRSPSTTSVRRDGVSAMEILNILRPSAPNSRKRVAKATVACRRSKLLNPLATVKKATR